MASYARDIYFAVRVEDRATRPLRRMARDFQALGKQGLVMRQRDVQAAQRQYASATAARRQAGIRVRDLAAQGSVIANNKRIADQERQILQYSMQRSGVLKNLPSLYSGIARQQARITEIDKSLTGGAARPLPMNQAQLQRAKTNAVKALGDLQKQEAAYAATLGLSGEQLGSQFRQMQSLEGEVNRLTVAEERNAAASQVAAGKRYAAIRGALASRQGLRDAETSLRRFPLDRIQGIMTYMRHAGTVLTTFGVIAVSAFALAGKAAADFSTEATIAATQSTVAGENTVRQVQKNARFIQQEILKLMQQGKTISTPTELTRQSYEIFSGVKLPGNQNQQLKEGIQLLREFNKLTVANAGLVTLEESTKAGIILMNRFGLSIREVPKALNTMQAAVRFGKLTMSEFVASLNQAAPAAQAAGYTFPQMASAVAFLSKQFPSLRMGVTGYARLLEILARKDIVQALNQHGVAVTHVVDGVQKLLPIQQIAANILDKFGGSVKQGSIFLQNFFKSIGGTTQGTIQARRVLTAYLQHLGQAKTVLKDVAGDNNELAKSLKAAQESPGVRWQEFVNQMRALGLAIGQGVLPAVSNLVPYVRGLATWFNNLSPHTKRMIGYLGALGAVGTLLGGIVLMVTGAFGSLFLALGEFFGAKGLGALADEAGFASVRFLALFGIVGPLLFVLIRYPGVFNAITDSVGGTANAVKLLVTYIAAVAVARRIGLFSGLITSATEATSAVMLLRAALLPLLGFGVITLTIAVLIDKRLRQTAHDWMHRQYEGLKEDAMNFGHDVAKAFTFGQANVLNYKSPMTKYAEKQFQEYQQVLQQHTKNLNTIVGRTNIPHETALLTAPTVDPNAQAALRQRMQMLQNQLRGASVFQRPQIMGAIAKIRTELEFPKNAQAMIDRARAMNDLKMRLPIDKQAFAGEIASIAVQMVRVLGFAVPNAIQQASRRAVRYFKNITDAAASVGATKITPNFRQLFANLIKARRLANEAAAALKLDPTTANQNKALRAWEKYQAALAALQAVGNEQQNAAAKKTADNLGNAQKHYSDAAILAEARKVQTLEKAAKNEKTFAAWKRYYSALNQLQAHATDAQMQAVDQILDVTTSKVNETAQKARDTINTILGNLQSMYNDFLQRNKDAFGQLFQGPFEQSAVIQDKMAYGYKLTARDMLRDLRSQIAQFRAFNRELALLQKRGAPPELIAQLRQLGPTALPQIKTLEKSSPRIWKAYLAEFNKSQKLIEQQTKRDMQNQLRLYRQQGRKIALAILSGMQSQDKKLTAWLRRLIAQMFPGLSRQAANAPQRPRRRDVAQVRRQRRQTEPARRSARSTTRRQRTTTRRAPRTDPRTKQYQTSEYNGPATIEYHDHYNITAPKGMEDSVLRQAKHAAWHARTRHRTR